MKESHKKRYLTKAKQELYNALAEDHTLIKMIADCQNAGLPEPHTIVLIDYVYHLGYDNGYKNATKTACDKLEQYFIETNKKNSGSIDGSPKPHG